MLKAQSGCVGRELGPLSPPAITLPGRIMHAPQYQKWSLELQQTFGVHSSMNLGYFGYHGIHGLVQEPDANAWGFGTLPATVPDARFSGVTTISSPGISNYNGLVTSFQHRFSRWTSGLFQADSGDDIRTNKRERRATQCPGLRFMRS